MDGRRADHWLRLGRGSNRIKVTTASGTKAASYDERNRLLSDGTSTYTYTPRGTMATKAAAGSNLAFSFDAFDRLITKARSRSRTTRWTVL
ncbi:hypothetical protein ACQPXM_25600 [Kribbella sp. CA-253562]|uniref:hypothetical protein n=1 Tax=Kribbella sp. CA-253562 TaxID=3239942 RepID=UPI003D8E1DA6